MKKTFKLLANVSLITTTLALNTTFNTAFAESKPLTGVVLDEKGQPVAGAQVHLRAQNQTTVTDEQGKFTFESLDTGRYVIDIEAKKLGHINQSVNHDGALVTLTLDDHEGETIVVTGNPLEHSSLEMAAPAVVIAGDELIKNRGANIGETLSEVPGVNLSSFGVGAGRPVIRGQQGNRVTVLSNNSSTQDASNASPDHWIAAEPLLAKRVEILKGPATLLYGGGAVGGAVNVVDDRIPRHKVSDSEWGAEGGFEVRAGDSATGEQATVGALTFGKDNIAFHIDAFHSKTDDIEIPSFAESEALRHLEEAEHEHEEHEHEEHEHEEAPLGYLENSSTKTHGGSVGFSYVTDDSFWGLSYSEFDRNYGLPGHAEHAREEEHEEEGHEEEHEPVRLDLKQKRWDIKGQWNKPFEGFQNLKIHLAKTDYQHQEIEGHEVGTTFNNDALETRLELVHESWSGWQGAFGLQFNDNDFSALGAEAFIPASNTKKLGLFWLEEKNIGDWHNEIGIRFDKQQIQTDLFGERDDSAFSFAAGTVWHINDHWSLPINFARAQRLPQVEELYSNAGNDEDHYVPHLATLSIEVGNPNLGKETANNLDIGLRYHKDDVHASIAVFHNRVNDFIYQELIEEDHHEEEHEEEHVHELPIFQFAQQDAIFEGVEAEIDWTFADNGQSFWRAGVFGDYTHAEFDSADGAYIPRQPAKRFGFNLGYEWNDFSADLKAIRSFSQNKLAQSELRTDGYDLVNLNLGYNLYFDSADVLLFLRAQNLLDEEIRDHASFLKDRAPRAGRSLTAGFRVTF